MVGGCLKLKEIIKIEKKSQKIVFKKKKLSGLKTEKRAWKRKLRWNKEDICQEGNVRLFDSKVLSNKKEVKEKKRKATNFPMFLRKFSCKIIAFCKLS